MRITTHRALFAGCLIMLLLACGTAQPRTERATATPASSRAAAQSTATPAAPTTVDYAALPQSKTAEGYYVLGAADAPVVLTHYSDFL